MKTLRKFLSEMMPPSGKFAFHNDHPVRDTAASEKVLLDAVKTHDVSHSSVIRTLAAGHKNATDKVLNIASKDHDFTVRHAVAGNKKTPTNILHKLKNDEHPYVREAARYQLEDRIDDLRK